MSYGEPVTVPPGAQITIKNDDSVEHSVTSDAAGKFTVDVDGNEQGTLTAPIRTGRIRVPLQISPLHARDADRQVVAGENRSHADWRVIPNAAPMRAHDTPRSRSS